MTICPPLPALIQVAAVCLAVGVAVGLFLGRLLQRTGRYLTGRIHPDLAGGWHRRQMPETLVLLQICRYCQTAYRPEDGHQCPPDPSEFGVPK